METLRYSLLKVDMKKKRQVRNMSGLVFTAVYHQSEETRDRGSALLATNRDIDNVHLCVSDRQIMGMLDEDLQAMDNTHTSAAQPRTHLAFFYYYFSMRPAVGRGELDKIRSRGSGGWGWGGGNAITPQPPSVTRIIDD